jgi:calpain, invertebrate
MGAAKEFIGQAINEMFIKKEATTKRVLPSIANMKIVSLSLAEI